MTQQQQPTTQQKQQPAAIQPHELAQIKAHGVDEGLARSLAAQGIGGGTILAWITKYGPMALQLLQEFLQLTGGGGGAPPAPAAAPAPAP